VLFKVGTADVVVVVVFFRGGYVISKMGIKNGGCSIGDAVVYPAAMPIASVTFAAYAHT
jgi:hypothetical protein